MHKFPLKLHAILSDPNLEDIITWLPNGTSWRVVNREMFEKEVIPLYFRHRNYSSFMRQVNGWGFQRVDCKDTFQHEVSLYHGKPRNYFYFFIHLIKPSKFFSPLVFPKRFSTALHENETSS